MFTTSEQIQSRPREQGFQTWALLGGTGLEPVTPKLSNVICASPSFAWSRGSLNYT
jgi:hypothetical protein